MNILVFAPHPDDEILGCGATIGKHVANNDNVYVCIMTRGLPPIYDQNSFYDMLPQVEKAHKILGVKKTYYLEFPASMMESVPRFEINEKVLKVVLDVKPDIVYLPHFGDMQKDHSITTEAIMVAVRPKYKHIVRLVYAYETLSETEWNIPHLSNCFIPNVFNDISDYIDLKIDAMKSYHSQLEDFPNPRSVEALKSLAKYRGSTMCSEAAEAFMLIREYKKESTII